MCGERTVATKTLTVCAFVFFLACFGSQASSFEVGLVFTAYALAQTISTPISGLFSEGGGELCDYYLTQVFVLPGRLSDKFGRRNMILVSTLGSCLGFLFQGFSNSLWVFLVARFSAGIVGASIPIAMAFVCDVTTQKERPRCVCVSVCVWCAGTVCLPCKLKLCLIY